MNMATRTDTQSPALHVADSRPESVRQSHYFESVPAEQFDLLIHLYETWALEPLERESLWELGEVPETYPSGL
jgi:hypothetical protein